MGIQIEATMIFCTTISAHPVADSEAILRIGNWTSEISLGLNNSGDRT